MSTPYTPSLDTARNLYAVGRDEADGMIQAAQAFDEFDRLIRRIQAEALQGVRLKLNEHLLARHGAGHTDYALELLAREANRIRGEQS